MAIQVSQPLRSALMQACNNDERLVREIENLFIEFIEFQRGNSTLTDGSSNLIASSVDLTNGAGAGAGTLTNAPSAGDPSRWIPIDDNGTIRYIPTWT